MIDVMIDIDDVLFPWADGIHERCRVAGLHDQEEYLTWHMWEDYGVAKEAWLAVVADATLDGFYVDTPPYPGVIEALRRLTFEHDHVAIHLVTARGFVYPDEDQLEGLYRAEQIRAWTDEWVHEHAVPHKTLSFAKNKVAVQRDLGVRFDYAIDDGPHNVKDLAKAGILTYMLDRPHNRTYAISGAFRVHSVDEFVDIILRNINETAIEEMAARAL